MGDKMKTEARCRAVFTVDSFVRVQNWTVTKPPLPHDLSLLVCFLDLFVNKDLLLACVAKE